MARLRHLNVKQHVYFITSRTAEGKFLFASSENAEVLRSAIYFGRENGWYLLLAFTIMPDHFHLLIIPKGRTVSKTMQGIKGYVSRILGQRGWGSGIIWQPGFYDYVVDSEDKLFTKARYIEENPLRKGLVARPDKYMFCSAHEGNPTDLDIVLGGQPYG